MANLLAVDWDFFFPVREWPEEGWQLYDWTHREAPFFLGPVWEFRARHFILAGLDLPTLSGEEQGFWERFRISPNAPLLYADSNAWAATGVLRREVNGPSSHVWLYDAHHDTGYRNTTVESIAAAGEVSCENWMIAYALEGARLHVRYPRWRRDTLFESKPVVRLDRRLDTGARPRCTFDYVFVCRSGGWVPPWHDGAFHAFVEAAPVRRRDRIDEHEPRPFDHDEVRARAEEERRQIGVIRGRAGEVQRWHVDGDS